jgi:hypothetical protein
MSSIILFEEKTVRRAWDAENQKWLFAIVDVLGILTESTNPAVYWRVLKKRLRAEGNQTVTNCNGLKMTARMNMTSLTSASLPSGVLSQVVRELVCDMNRFASPGRAEYGN